MGAFVFFVTLTSVVGFLYKKGPCPGIPAITLKNTDLDRVIFHEFLRYPESDLESVGLYTESCKTFFFDITNNFLYKNHTRVSNCGGKTHLELIYRVDFYDQSEVGAFRVAQYSVGSADVLYDDLYMEPTHIGNRHKQIWLEDFDLRVIQKVASDVDDRKWVVVWGCDQINNDTNRQSLHVLCNYDCNQHLETIGGIIADDGVSLEETENCEGYQQRNAATPHFSHIYFVEVTLVKICGWWWK